MKRMTFFLLLIVTCIPFVNLYAQTDSGYVDLGRVKLRKDFTQLITIKGEDLEKFPFSSLHEAINVYLYGTYTNAETMSYVVDGILLNDVNAYSVFDIESITLVQNAVGHINGATAGTHVVLITTRMNGQRKPGITAAVSSAFIKARHRNDSKSFDGVKAPNFFQQYYLSANQKKGKWNFGASANFLRDVAPIDKEVYSNTSNPSHISRFRLNAWINARLGNRSYLSLKMNAAPQQRDNELNMQYMSPLQTSKLNGRELILYPSLRIATKISESLSNDLSASYISSYHKNKQYSTYSGIIAQYTTNNYDSKDKILRIKDDIRYTRQLGKWQLEPALNVMYTHAKSKTEQIFITSGGNAPWPTTYIQTQKFENKGDAFLLTPSLGIYLKNVFSLLGGFQLNANPFGIFDEQKTKICPYASASVDILKIKNKDNVNSIKLFGSYSRTSNWNEYVDGLTDLNSSFNGIPSSFVYGPIGSVNIVNSQAKTDPGNIWQAGVNFGILRDKVQISYNYENSHLVNLVGILSGGGINNLVSANVKSDMHRLSIAGQIANSTDFSWKAGVNISGRTSQVENLNSAPPTYTSLEKSKEERQWSGGWVNHFSYRSIMAGFNIYYCFKHPTEQLVTYTVPAYPMPGSARTNVFLLQHIYAGYKLPTSRFGSWEVYANGRNLFQIKKQNIMIGERKSYGLGAKVDL